ncbi:hypothetical protein [Saccharopolyspora taberi]|uniref:Uncharacterized protein n=1 Tax=Saccharopolyspora taberi TaxID=60895 RepID=A0ABN3VDE8_9PSEU
MTETDQRRQDRSVVSVVVAVITDLLLVPFLVFTYGFEPQGDWDRGAIDVLHLAAQTGTGLGAVVLAVQLGLVVAIRKLGWAWLLVPLVALILFITKAVLLGQEYPVS